MKKRSPIISVTVILCVFLIINMSTVAFAAATVREWLWPVPDSIRMSSCYGDGRNHRAIDIAAPQGTPVIASMGGTVVHVYTGCAYNTPKTGNCPCGQCGNLGNSIYIEHTYKGAKYVSRYGHLTDVNVKIGDTVKTGRQIGTVGSTGRSGGFHLDFQIYRGTIENVIEYIDPLKSPFLKPPKGFNANAASTSCCYLYVNQVYEILNEESDYLSKCTVNSFTDYIGTAASNADIMSMPCSDSVFEYSYRVNSIIKNTELFVLKQVKNTVGETWYLVEMPSGTQGYVKADAVSAVQLTPGYARVKAPSSVKSYKMPRTSADAAKTYSQGDLIVTIGSIKDAGGNVWYYTSEGGYIPRSSLGNLTYSSSLKLSGTPYPYDKLAQGKAHSISGTVTSNNRITAVSVVIINSSGKTLMSKTAGNSTTRYSFRGSELDYALPFSSLSAGTYTYKLAVRERAVSPDGKTSDFVTFFENKFAVGQDYKTGTVTITAPTGEKYNINVDTAYSANAKYDTVTINSGNYPETLEKGQAFSIRGTIVSAESALTSVSVSVKNTAGSNVINASENPRTRTYSLANLDSKIKFGSLDSGRYSYVVTASNDAGTFTLVNHGFEVKGEDNNGIPVGDGSLDNFKAVRTYDNRFTDVKDNDWFKDNVSMAYSLNMINGISDKSFAPNANLSVIECITLASKIHSIYYNTGYDFTSDNELWYSKYVSYALANKIIDAEYSDYNAYITRDAVAEMFAKVLPGEALPEISTVADNAIPDVKIGDTAAAAIYKLYRAGILKGADERGTFAPKSYVLRSEISAIVTRLAVSRLRLRFTL